MSETVVTVVGNLTAESCPTFERNYGKLKTALKERANAPQGLTQAIDLGDWRAAVQSTEPELWCPVVGYEGLYEVSDRGRIRRSPRARGRGAKPGRVLATNGNGRTDHQWVTLFRDGVGRKVYVHRAVAQAFVPGPPRPVVRHLDDDPTNNVPANLAWGTQADNVHDMVARGRARNGWSDAVECIHGHPFDPENTYITKRGRRSCRACGRNRAFRNYHRQEAS